MQSMLTNVDFVGFPGAIRGGEAKIVDDRISWRYARGL
jgi:hypothetical protein